MAKDRYEDPQYGTFVGIDEASTLSLIPKGTLRLWRRDEYKHLARFRFLTIDKKVWYPLSDIERYQKENNIDPMGNRSALVFDEERFSHLPPLPAAKIEPKQHEAIIAARRLNRNNHRELRLKWLKDYDNPTMAYFSYVKKFLPELTELWFKGETPTPFIKAYPGYDGLHPAVNTDPDPADRERYDFIMTNITRLIDADLNNRELSAADVAAIPVI